MNSVNLVGRITATPELKQTTTGKSVVNFSLAVKRPRVKDATDFFKIIAWAHTAEYVSRYAHKGDTMVVSGIITNREYEQNGRKVFVTEIVADDVQVLGGRQGTTETETAPAVEGQTNDTVFKEVTYDESLPY